LCGNVFGQNLKTANYLFDNFEFRQAIQEYEKFDDLAKLDNENQQKLGYCYYVTGDVEGGLPFLNLTEQKQKDEAHFWLWKGTLEKENKEFDKAIQSFKIFQTKTDELNAEVNLLIKSCEAIPSWDSIPRTTIDNLALNTPYAESCSMFNQQIVFFKEIGLDSTGNLFNIQSNSNLIPEVLLMTPFLDKNDSLTQSMLFSKIQMMSINRVQTFSDNSKIIFSASDPLNKNKLLQTQQIYTADLISFDKPIENVKLWQYAGLQDTSSCSHVCLSPNNQKIVFTKTSRKTEGSDLYSSDFKNGQWSEPTPLNIVNTRGNEMFPLFENDSILQFSTDGRIGYGGLDIFTVNLKNTEEDSNIKHLHFPINSSMDDHNLIWKDSLNGYFVSNRISGKGDDDIWKLTTKPEEIPDVVDDGFKKWYDEWNLKLIYFDFDSFESEVNQEFIKGCKKYFEKYNVAIKLIGHTDARGTPDYNMFLGLNRCKWLEKQLKDANVLNTMILQSVGETQLVNKCDSKTKCSDTEHSQNRYVQIFIQFDQKIIE
jgi:tetratricopeptide (TPR) repeat protein